MFDAGIKLNKNKKIHRPHRVIIAFIQSTSFNHILIFLFMQFKTNQNKIQSYQSNETSKHKKLFYSVKFNRKCSVSRGNTKAEQIPVLYNLVRVGVKQLSTITIDGRMSIITDFKTTRSTNLTLIHNNYHCIVYNYTKK
uniref:CSON008147 protein n=1 Tax=Culicoides sonorensis TaxID=179676 RepID=A0A336MWK1_CULSO